MLLCFCMYELIRATFDQTIAFQILNETVQDLLRTIHDILLCIVRESFRQISKFENLRTLFLPFGSLESNIILSLIGKAIVRGADIDAALQ